MKKTFPTSIDFALFISTFLPFNSCPFNQIRLLLVFKLNLLTFLVFKLMGFP